jgi:hypothetical protein
MYIGRYDYNESYKQRKIDFLTNMAIVFLFVLIVINIFLVAFFA